MKDLEFYTDLLFYTDLKFYTDQFIKEITEQLQSLYNDGELLSQSIVSELVAEAFAENLTLRTFVEGDPIDFLVDEVLGNIQLSL